MPTQPERERDRMDQWISQVLTAGCEDAQPSERVWQRLSKRVERLSPQVNSPQAEKRKGLSAYLRLDWSEQREGRVGIPGTLLGVVWSWLYSKPLPYA